MKLEDHPTVLAVRGRAASDQPATPLDAAWLKAIALEHGADDVGLVSIDTPAIDDQRSDIRKVLPGTKTLLSFVCRMNREPVRNPARSVSNLEFHHTADGVNEVARSIVAALEARGVVAVNPAMGFPMEMSGFPGKIWMVSHKPVAVAAGLGMIGIHRNVIHPKFGNFILLGTVLIGAEATAYDAPIEYNPCLACKLCVAACPVGAIAADGAFDFSACYTHNYREFMGGFADWVEHIADSPNGHAYRKRVTAGETASMWQSLAFGPNYKAAYCIAVCPAGEDVIGPYLDDKRGHLDRVVKPLQQKQETIYAVPGSDAEENVLKRFPHKQLRRVRGSLLPQSIPAFLEGMPHVFQRGKSAGLNATYHFRFTGAEPAEATIRIAEGKVHVEPGLTGACDLRVTADSKTWLGFLAKERNLVWALLTGRIRLWGNPVLLAKFGQCFPS